MPEPSEELYPSSVLFPSTSVSFTAQWNQPKTRIFETGLDRGMLYLKTVRNSTSRTTSDIGLGTKTFELSRIMTPSFRVGSRIRVQADEESFMDGVVTVASSSSVTIEIDGNAGSGTYSLWQLTSFPGIPWNGLTSVEENGGEGTVSYYVDGRPFLHLPTPKEFSATLNAYTYPEEFAEITGLAEATDGMYVDSQVGEGFHLSYRTLIGSGVDGTAAGYKIHLVYNATVVPSSVSYQSMGDSINPVEFSWEVQAVPVSVEGYRATAHVTIDSRNMDPEKLLEIESMLYGDGTNAPMMPPPQMIFDTLTYGDAIIIVDNEDGTWEAIGSYENIYMIGDGIFQIDNVNATDNGDGTYYISSTP